MLPQMLLVQLDGLSLAALGALCLIAFGALAFLLADPDRLPRLMLGGLEDVLGAERVAELRGMQAAWERKVLSPYQLTVLQLVGAALGALVGLVLLFLRQPPLLALALGLAAAGLGAAYPRSAFHAGLLRRQVQQAEEYIVDFLVFLRQNLTLGVPVETAIRDYVETQRNPLADLFAGMPSGTGADPVLGVAEMAMRSGSEILLPLAMSMKLLRGARDPRGVLEQMEIRALEDLAARIKEENEKRRLVVLAVTVSLSLLSILALILVPTVLRLIGAQVF